ncbi:MAG: alpha-mannosidase [Acidobacteria bacterium]|nr:alpha-mannosidase [Acidobacteriota bacterium]
MKTASPKKSLAGKALLTGSLIRSLITQTAVLAIFVLASQSGIAQLATTPDRHKDVGDKLQALTLVQLSGCKWHADVTHPEDPALDESSWKPIALGAKFESGVQVVRCWYTTPKNVDGYDIRGASLKVAFELQGDGMTMLSAYSNNANVFRGNSDTLEPILLTTSAQPDQRFLIALRLQVGELPRTLYRSEILIEPPASRPDPGLLRLEVLSLQPILNAYPDPARQQVLDSAVQAIDFSKLNAGDQNGFDASLQAAQARLQELKPWVQQFRIRAVGNSHIDMAWLWPWTETVEIVRNTYRSALDMMQEYPGFKFAGSSARTYEWLEEKYPELFQEIQQRVKEGRWEIVGGMWVEPDLNMPGGESLTRQILIGKQYFKKKFGVDVKIGWNPDSFGYNWQLPQIYKKSGIDYFVTQKLLWAHEFTTFPHKLFWWEAPDGSRLLTYFPHDYGSSMEPIPMAEDVGTWIPSMYPANAKDPVMMYLYGVGDHGGGPTRTMLDQGKRLMNPDVVFPKVEFSTAGAFFDDLDKRNDLKIPVWKNELYFQYHRGVFTTQAETKKHIRHAEETLLDAEKYASLAHLYQRAYPQEEFTAAWKSLLFDQFHDIMPGSGIAVNYLEAKRDLEIVERSGNGILEHSFDEISSRIDTSKAGTPIVVYNSMSWPRTDVIEGEAQLPASSSSIEVVDSTGKAVPSQVLDNKKETHHVRFLFRATVPAVGYATFYVRPTAKAASAGSSLKATSENLENEFVRLKVDPQTGCITSLFDKQSKQETLAPAESDTGGPKNVACGNLLQTFVDKPKEFDAWNIDADFEKQYWSLDKADEVKLAESGPLRAVIRVKHHFQNSSFVQDITMYPGVPRVDVNMQTEWNEKHILLKVAFPVSVHSKTATFEIPFGSIERPTTRNTPEEQAQFEVPGQHWADLSDERHGLSLLNDSKYGYDAKGNVLRLSLLRSPSWPDAHADEGHHEFTYSLYPHGGTWKTAETVRRGYELNYKLRPAQVQSHSGSLPPVHSFIGLSSDNVVLTAMKWAEDDGAVILRFYEWAGKEADVRVQLPPGAMSASETNLIEQSIGNLAVTNGSVTVHTKPYEIKTVAVKFASESRP